MRPADVQQIVWKANRALWWRSFPFHFGLYLLTATGAVVVVEAAVRLSGAGGGFVGVLHVVALTCGLAGISLSIAGAAGLLQRRLTDPNLRGYTTPGDVFNLLFFLGALVLAASGYATRAAGTAGVGAVAAGLLSCDSSVRLAPAFAGGLCAVAALVAYIPLTHMSHFIGKYFTYHAVRWDDAPARGHARMAARMAEYLTYRPTWSARHIGADGTKTWADVVSSNPTGRPKS